MTTNAAMHRANEDDRPGIVGRPILVVLLSLPLGFALDHLLPLARPFASTGPVHDISAVVAAGMILIGFAATAAGIRNFRRAGTAVPTNEPARALVTTGIHSRSRNPIYVGFLSMVLGVGILVRSPWILILVAPLAIYLRYGVIEREEAYLERRFGDLYRDYRARVRRWL